MKTFIATPVIVPSDLAERFDERAGMKAGHLRNLMAEAGKLHDIDDEMLSIALMAMVKHIMENPDLPDGVKPLSVERLSNVIYAVMFGYCIGTMRVDEDGDATIGEGIEDVKKAVDILVADKIKFANGKTMATKEFMSKLRNIAAPESLERVHKEIVKRHGLHKGIKPSDASHVARVSIMTAKQLMNGAI
jgi:hypothetical protein